MKSGEAQRRQQQATRKANRPMTPDQQRQAERQVIAAHNAALNTLRPHLDALHAGAGPHAPAARIVRMALDLFGESAERLYQGAAPAEIVQLADFRLGELTDFISTLTPEVAVPVEPPQTALERASWHVFVGQNPDAELTDWQAAMPRPEDMLHYLRAHARAMGWTAWVQVAA